MKIQTRNLLSKFNLKASSLKFCVSGPRGDLFNIRIIPASGIMMVRLCKSPYALDRDISAFHIKWQGVEWFSAGYTGNKASKVRNFEQWIDCKAIL